MSVSRRRFVRTVGLGGAALSTAQSTAQPTTQNRDLARDAAAIVAEVMSAFGSGAARGASEPYPDGQIFDSPATGRRFTEALLKETEKNLSKKIFTYDEWAANTGGVHRPTVLATASEHGNEAAKDSSRKPINWGTVVSTFRKVKKDCPSLGPICPVNLDEA